MKDDSICILTPGLSLAAGAASATTAIGNASNGSKPRYIRVSALAPAYVAVGTSTVTAATTGILVQPADAVILALWGATHIAVIQGGAATTVNVQYLEDS